MRTPSPIHAPPAETRPIRRLGYAFALALAAMLALAACGTGSGGSAEPAGPGSTDAGGGVVAPTTSY